MATGKTGTEKVFPAGRELIHKKGWPTGNGKPARLLLQLLEEYRDDIDNHRQRKESNGADLGETLEDGVEGSAAVFAKIGIGGAVHRAQAVALGLLHGNQHYNEDAGDDQ